MAIRYEPIYSYQIKNNDTVYLKTMGWIYQITYMEHRNTKQNIVRIDKDHYKNLKTDEIKEVKHKTSRADSKKTAKQSLRKLRELINTNIEYPWMARWITLTYKENMTDVKRLYKDFDKFMKRLKYAYSDYNIEYINVCEPQARGAWHCHLILVFDKIAPFIENKKLAEIWGHGFTKITAIDNIDNIGTYLTSYLSDMDLEEVKKSNINYNEDDIVEKTLNDNTKKKIVKNARLELYPPGTRIYRKSRGIKNPKIERLSYKRAKEKIGVPYPTFCKGIKLIDDDIEYSNIIYKEYYNIRAKELKMLQENGRFVSVFNNWIPVWFS